MNWGKHSAFGWLCGPRDKTSSCIFGHHKASFLKKKNYLQTDNYNRDKNLNFRCYKNIKKYKSIEL